MAKITAYRKDTGEEVRIPEHFLDHPELGKPFRKTRPSDKPARAQADAGASTNKAADAAAKEK
jgi:hypothetical protein